MIFYIQRLFIYIYISLFILLCIFSKFRARNRHLQLKQQFCWIDVDDQMNSTLIAHDNKCYKVGDYVRINNGTLFFEGWLQDLKHSNCDGFNKFGAGICSTGFESSLNCPRNEVSTKLYNG